MPTVDEVMRLIDRYAGMDGCLEDELMSDTTRIPVLAAIRSLVERPVSDEVEAMAREMELQQTDYTERHTKAAAMLRSLSVDATQPESELWAEIHRLRAAMKGPDGYATWQEAAEDERIKRVRLEGLNSALHKQMDAEVKAAQRAQPQAEPHGWYWDSPNEDGYIKREAGKVYDPQPDWLPLYAAPVAQPQASADVEEYCYLVETEQDDPRKTAAMLRSQDAEKRKIEYVAESTIKAQVGRIAALEAEVARFRDPNNWKIGPQPVMPKVGTDVPGMGTTDHYHEPGLGLNKGDY